MNLFERHKLEALRSILSVSAQRNAKTFKCKKGKERYTTGEDEM